MTTFCDVAQSRAGETPGTYNGSMTVTLSSTGRKILGFIVSNSFSAYTTEEGGTLLFQYSLSSGPLPGNQYVVAGLPWTAGPATNHAMWIRPMDIIPMDIDAAGNTIVSMDLSSSGATQTGTLDGTFGVQYCDSQFPPGDWMMKYPIPVAFRGGVLNFNTAIAGSAAETLLQSQKSSGNNIIPGIARELVALRPVMTTDTAVTAAEEHTGYFRIDGTISGLNKQKYPSNSMDPGAGTEVEGGAGHMVPWIPIHIPTPGNTDYTLQFYYTLYAASTGGVCVALGCNWR